MKKYIVFSHDLSPDMPPRHLLVATAAFWDDKVVKGDSIYQQVAPIVQNAQPFPNDFTPSLQSDMDKGICVELKKSITGYKCKW
jgi:hypothetical protein